MKLALGTVQFGLAYGINNFDGQVPFQEVSKILNQSNQYGIELLDTAAAYGESESILGKISVDSFKVVSKLPACESSEVKKYFEGSLQKVGVSRLYGYLFHDISSYFKNPDQLDQLREFKSQGLVEKIGFSLYDPQELIELIKGNVEFDLVQIPYSILDRRFSELLPKLSSHQVEVHTRSAFLQGIIFKEPKSLPERLSELGSVISQIQDIAVVADISVFKLALRYVLANSDISKVVIGVDNLKQLEANINAAAVKLDPKIIKMIDEVQIQNESLLMPSNW